MGTPLGDDAPGRPHYEHPATDAAGRDLGQPIEGVPLTGTQRGDRASDHVRLAPSLVANLRINPVAQAQR